MNKLFSYLHTKSREEKFRLFVKLLKPTPAMHILNVGASGPNFAFAEQFESLYEHRDQVTGGGISLSEVRDYRRSFPGVKALVFDGLCTPLSRQELRRDLFQCSHRALGRSRCTAALCCRSSPRRQRMVCDHAEFVLPSRATLP